VVRGGDCFDWMLEMLLEGDSEFLMFLCYPMFHLYKNMSLPLESALA